MVLYQSPTMPLTMLLTFLFRVFILRVIIQIMISNGCLYPVCWRNYTGSTHILWCPFLGGLGLEQFAYLIKHERDVPKNHHTETSAKEPSRKQVPKNHHTETSAKEPSYGNKCGRTRGVIEHVQECAQNIEVDRSLKGIWREIRRERMCSNIRMKPCLQHQNVPLEERD